MTEIYLIRHAQAEGNLYKMMQGHWDGALTELGLQQTAALRQRFEGVNIDAVYASDLQRTCGTAQAISAPRALPIHTDARLREINIGPWETKFFADLRHDEPELMYKFLEDSENWQLPGAETFLQVQARAHEAMCEIARRHEGQSIAVASHGITIRSFLSKVTGISLADRESLPIFNNTAVTRLLWERGSFAIDYMNDTSHLPDKVAPVWGRSTDLRGESMDPAQNRDWYCACYADSWQAAHGSLEGFTSGPYYRAALEHYAADSRAVLRILDRDEPVGLVDMDTLRGKGAGYGWISLIWLREDYRRRGCGVQLLARAMMHYKNLGRKTLRLHVAEDNTAAMAFYRRWGFKPLSFERVSTGKLWLMEREII